VDPDAVGMVRGVGRGMGVLDGDRDHRRGEAVFGVNWGRTILTNGDFATGLFPITLGSTCQYSDFARVRGLELGSNSI